MEAVFLVQPWIQARTAVDSCRLCYQERETKSHLECKRAHLSAYNSLLTVLRLEKGEAFEDALKRLEAAKEKCLSTSKPDMRCYEMSQAALKSTLELYDKILDECKKRLPSRAPSTFRM